MSEFEKLEKYLQDNSIPYERIDNYPVKYHSGYEITDIRGRGEEE